MNGFNEIEEVEQRRETLTKTNLILDLVKALKEEFSDIKEMQKTIREEVRNPEKLRALRK